MKTKHLKWGRVIASFLVLAPLLLAQQPKRPVTNADVIRMLHDNIPEPTILDSIRNRPGAFDLSDAGRTTLFAAGGRSRVSEMTRIWDAMTAKARNGQGRESATDLSTRPNPPKETLLTRGEQKTLLGSQAGSASGDVGKRPDDSNSQANPPRGKTIDPALQTKLGPVKAGATVKNPGVARVNAALIGVLEKQRSAADLEVAQMKLSFRPAMQAGLSGGSSQLMSATAGGGTSAVGASTPSATLNNTVTGRPGDISPKITHVPYVNTIALTCANDPTFRILNVSGSASAATFTPIDQYNLYTITGCSFGNPGAADKVYIYGAGTFHGNFAINFWSDNSIVVALDESITGYPDLSNISLVVQRNDGFQTQKQGFKFYAARQKVPLTTIPSSWVKLVTYENESKFLTPQYSSPPPSLPGPGPTAGSSYVSRSYNGEKFFPEVEPNESDYYDFSHLTPGWTTDSFQVSTYPQNCPFVVTYKEDFGAWNWDWDQKNPNNIRVWPSVTTCSGFLPPFPLPNYQNWSGSYYALRVWVIGPRGLDPWTGKPSS
jgi:hypothetical protein